LPLDENIAALKVWLNTGKSEELRTNALRLSTTVSRNVKHVGVTEYKPFGFVTTVATL